MASTEKIVCKRCKTPRDPLDFYFSSTSSTGRRGVCKFCDRKRSKLRKLSNRKSWLQSCFGLTEHEFDSLLREQNEQCRICDVTLTKFKSESGKSKTAHVDHCHTTGKVRGLLCGKCNSAIGYLQDDPKLLRKAAEYLEGKHG